MRLAIGRAGSALAGWASPRPDETPALAHRDKLIRFAGFVGIVLLAILPPAVGWVGYDYVHAYHDEVLSGHFGYYVFNPWPVYWMCYPYALLPLTWGYLLFNLSGAFGYIFALRRLGGHPVWFALSFPCYWTFTQGQLEGFMALGLALAMTAAPLWAGLGLVLLSFKPQLGLFPIIFVLFHRRDWRLLVVPGLVYGASFLKWGFWLPDWLAALRVAHDVIHVHPDSVSLFPFALVLIPLIWILRTNLNVWLMIQSLVMPVSALRSFGPALTVGSYRSLPLIVLGTWLLYLAKITRFPWLPGLGFVMLLALGWEVCGAVKASRVESSLEV